MSLQYLDLTMPAAVENIALDEALLEHAELAGGRPLLRIWEPNETIVVIGRSSAIAEEVDLDFCAKEKIPIFRRTSGGASIVTAAGCLMYAVLLDYRKQPELRMLETAHRYVMTKMQRALFAVGIDAEMNGTCDLTIGSHKFSGNAMRAKRNWMLYHGTMICDMDLDLIFNCLKMPSRQPDYREGRSHREFLTQIPVSISELKQSIVDEFNAVEPIKTWPLSKMKELIEQKYSRHEWNYKR